MHGDVVKWGKLGYGKLRWIVVKAVKVVIGYGLSGVAQLGCSRILVELYCL